MSIVSAVLHDVAANEPYARLFARVRYLCLPMTLPREVPPGTLVKMLALIRTFNVDKLRDKFLQAGILTSEDEGRLKLLDACL